MEEGELNGAIRSKVHHYTFPIMMKHKDSELVVIFVGRKLGMVLNALYDEGELIYGVGEIEDDWTPVDDPCWSPIHSILLTQ